MRRSIAPLAVLAFSLFLTGVATALVWLAERARDEARFERAAVDAMDRIDARLDTYIALLRGGAALFAASDSVEPAEFRTYVERLDVPLHYPGIQGIGFTRRVAPAELAAFEAEVRERLHPDFAVRPDSAREEYHAILYLEPLDRRNRAAIGFDMYTDSTRRTAMRRAAETGAPALSGRVTLVQEIDEQKQAGFLVYVPVYRGGHTPASASERRRDLAGFVYAPFRADDLFAGIFSRGLEPRVAFRIYDGVERDPERLLHDSEVRTGPVERGHRFTATRAIETAGHHWTVDLTSLPSLQATSGVRFAPAVAGLGVLISLVLFGLARIEAASRLRAEERAAEVRRGAAERERMHREAEARALERDTVLRQLAEGVIIADPEGRITFVNDAAREIHGTAELGVPVEDYARTYRLLAPQDEPFPPEELPLARAVKAGETIHGAEWKIRRPDGTTVLARGTATPVRTEEGTLLGAVLTLRDVTGEERLRRELETERARLDEVFNTAPAMISVTHGPEHRFVLANPGFVRAGGGRTLVGRTLLEAFPELAGQEQLALRDHVFASGEPCTRTEAPAILPYASGTPEESFFNYVFQPLFDADGAVEGILTFAVDVTDQVRARRQREEQAAAMEAQAQALRSRTLQLEEARSELEDSNRELQRANRELQHTNDELIRLSVELESARDIAVRARNEAEAARRVADAANQAKSQFLANMSHELRTPINAIIGYADLLDAGVAGPLRAAQHGYLARIDASSRHLSGLIDEVLDLAKVEAGELTARRDPVVLRSPVEAALAMVVPQAAAKGIDLVQDRGCAWDLGFLGDEDRVRQILVNLLGNAVKFTDPGGSTTLTCRQEPPPRDEADATGRVVIEVIDTGIGIAEDHLERIFQPFIQVEGGHTRRHGGTGLGLTISRRLARLMGGDLVASSRLGEGSTFTLSLPAAAVPAAVAGSDGRETDVGNETTGGDTR